MSDVDELRRLLAEADPAPWIRPWASTEVHGAFYTVDGRLYGSSCARLAIASKFNRTSAKIGAPHRLPEVDRR